MKTKSARGIVLKSACILFILLSFFRCKEDIQVPPKANEELVMSEYIANNSDFSEFNELVINTGLDGILSIRGPYSLFLPNNSAMNAFYAEKNISSFLDLDSADRKDLVYSHIIPEEFTIADYQLGTLGEKNALGDNIVTEFQGAEIIINKHSKIIKRDVRVSNGTIQIIDKVLEPLKLSVFEVLDANPSYSIFTEGLRRTGLNDTLQIISFKYGQNYARTRFTVLTVADTTFNRYGIISIDDLIGRYTGYPDSVAYPDNAFYAYMDFHCLDNNAYYTSDFADAATLYSVLSKNNNIQIKVENGEIKINANSADGSYTGLYIEQSNIPAKNGAIHTIDKLLEVTEPAPTTFVWEVTDFFDFKQGEYYLSHFQKFYDTAQFVGIRWEGEYLQYYIKPAAQAQAQLNDDCLNMIGFWKIEVTTPKIMKGQYLVASRIWSGISFAAYIDGEQTNIIKSSDAPSEASHSAADATKLFKLGEVNWTTTSEHKIKLVAVNSGTLFWDRIEFIPIE
ncbi:MAG: fasciclin domain-containing protein [Bacteroidales bacterium]|nr:fasciclin domain-containing protein [Bacteroidales bacterium]